MLGLATRAGEGEVKRGNARALGRGMRMYWDEEGEGEGEREGEEGEIEIEGGESRRKWRGKGWEELARMLPVL